MGSNGIITLSSLNGTNGFKLDKISGDYSGMWTSNAGDINGDGYADLLIGANGHAEIAGRSYVVFGGSKVGMSGLLSLADLNGINGFKLDGEVAGDSSALPVSFTKDINGDGVTDLLIGAPYHNNSMGRSYVVFGDVPPVLVNNSLLLSVGATITLNATYLAATDRNHNNNTLVFSPVVCLMGIFKQSVILEFHLLISRNSKSPAA